MFVGVDRYLGGRIGGDTHETLLTRAKLVSEIRSIFATYNVMRAAARNCMWMGLVCLVVSMMLHVDPFEGNKLTLPPSAKTCTFFIIWAFLSGPAWCMFGSFDFKLQFLVSTSGVVVIVTDIVFFKSGVAFERIVAFLIMSPVIVLVPYTVRTFRSPLLVYVKRFSNVF